MTVLLIFVFMFFFTGFALACGGFAIMLDGYTSLKTILGYLLFLIVLAIPTVAVGYLVWQRLVL